MKTTRNEIFDIEEELGKLPQKPGVYIMHDENEAILYVGKATNLHNRVRQYFRAGHGHNNSPKIAKMVSQISYFEYIITASEMEALVLECNLIKEHRPKYNTLMTDDKGYPYIKITITEDYPRIMMSHRMGRDRALYFGPYTDRGAVHSTIQLIKKLFSIRNCNKDLNYGKLDDRPCLYHQIGQCDAPCAGQISKEDYKKKIDKAVRFLNGDTKEITKELKDKMLKQAENMEFEKAAETRDLLDSISKISEKQRVDNNGSEDRDIIAIARNASDSVIAIFFVRDGTLLGRENHHMSSDENDTDADIITEFIKQYYMGTPFIPKEILTVTPINEEELLTNYLSERKGQKVLILVPQKGDKKGLIKLAQDNARLVLEQDIERIKRAEKRTIGACQDIADLIGVEKASRMEAFDISNISGYHSVASMVVFENGKPRRNAYRKFKLRTVEGPDDYASMKEVLSRRYTDERIGELPDIIMMDGGKGQVHVAEMIMDSLGLDIPVCGMVKDDNHRTRGLYYKDKELEFPTGSEAIHMITALQDETHRFAITYHKQLRSEGQTHSILDDIQGIGPKRRKALLLHFKDIEAIKNATIDELEAVDGMNQKAAEAVYNFFN
ncbi:Excinuclease ABC subunit C [Lachnospiraceae bacterium NE2001]|nr:Excinuclease ABC subunit C [Lachnospiraceae bacterium NE2001]